MGAVLRILLHACKDFSSFQRLVRVTAWVLKFIAIIAMHKKCQTRNLTPEDLATAELLWLKEAQNSLRTNVNYDSWRREFKLFTDENGLLRCGGRVAHADIQYETKHPVLLDSTHRITTLIVEECHRRVQHNGTKDTLTELRSRFWLVKGRQFIRKIIHRCTTCRRI